MNSSIVSMPSPLFLTIYYWFLQISFFISWLITPILFYTILTQSKQLKNYKWFILNHSLWCFSLETIIGLFKPLLLLPAFAGFTLSLFKENGNYHVTAIATILGFISGISYAASLFVTVASRYMTTFPSPLTNWITRKLLICISLVAVLTLYPLIVIATISAFSSNSATVSQEATAFDAFFNTIAEPSLVFVPLENVKTILMLVLLILLLLFIGGIALIFVFKYLVEKNSTVSVSQRSMIASSVVQILLSLLFLDLPLFALIISILFQIPHFSIYACICVSLISIHNVLESFATFYFVLPFRKFIQKQFDKIFKFRKTKNESSVVNLIVVYNKITKVAGGNKLKYIIKNLNDIC